MTRFFYFLTIIAVLTFGCAFVFGYTTSPEYKNSIQFTLAYTPEIIWKEMLNIQKIPERKKDVTSVEVLEEFGKLVAWQENLKNGGYRIYRMNKKEEGKNLVLELTDSSYGLTGVWSFELRTVENRTMVIISENSRLDNTLKRGYRRIVAREYDLLVWQKYIKVGLAQALLLTP